MAYQIKLNKDRNRRIREIEDQYDKKLEELDDDYARKRGEILASRRKAIESLDSSNNGR